MQFSGFRVRVQGSRVQRVQEFKSSRVTVTVASTIEGTIDVQISNLSSLISNFHKSLASRVGATITITKTATITITTTTTTTTTAPLHRLHRCTATPFHFFSSSLTLFSPFFHPFFLPFFSLLFFTLLFTLFSPLFSLLFSPLFYPFTPFTLLLLPYPFTLLLLPTPLPLSSPPTLLHPPLLLPSPSLLLLLPLLLQNSLYPFILTPLHPYTLHTLTTLPPLTPLHPYTLPYSTFQYLTVPYSTLQYLYPLPLYPFIFPLSFFLSSCFSLFFLFISVMSRQVMVLHSCNMFNVV